MRQLYQRLWRMMQRLGYEDANVVLLVCLSVCVASILRHFNQRFLVFSYSEISAVKYHIVFLLNKRIIAYQASLFRLQHN